ncbi:hypothetical protein ABE073_04695 [Lederbergia citrisecunda]|uniref:hypothetical protein n=1 Tax=Lederbergia citrisecunda TaxID=2833583 RepID=UPI003D2BADE9
MKKHMAIVQAGIYRRLYEIGNNYKYGGFYRSSYGKNASEKELDSYEDKLELSESYKIVECKEIKKYENIWEGEIDAPLLEIGEKLYIEELDIEIVVSERIRHSNGAYIYRTLHEVKVVEDDESKDSKDKANKSYDEIQENIKTYKAKIEELKPQIEQLKQAEHDNYYDENGLIRAFPKDYVERKNKMSWLERWFG